MDISRAQALAFRHHRQALASGSAQTDARVLDLGVQDTGGPAAARWALAQRGHRADDAELIHAWTLRGAPHAYRRDEVAGVAAATAPYDEADAAKRVFDASKPLREAGIPILEALDTIAEHLRDIVAEPMVKGEVSTALTARLPAPYLRECRPCGAVHSYEQTFRLSALRAGLELQPESSPPVLRPIPAWRGPAAVTPERLDPIRAVIALLGPTTPKLTASYLDAPVRTVRAHWPGDVADVVLDGERRQVLVDDLDALRDPPTADGVRLLGAFDPWLQTRDRDLLVGDSRRRAELWRTLGRPGAVLRGHEVIGTWRPRSKGATLRLHVVVWDGSDPPPGTEEQAEQLASHRGQRFGGWSEN
jgi:hypothetical protein